MAKNRSDHIQGFHQKVKAANKEATKKELFKDLLNRLFASNDETKEVIDVNERLSIARLVGARDVHKKILDVYFPRFNKADSDHQHLAQLSDKAHQKASEYLRTNPPEHPLTPGRLGRLRHALKVHLKAEMKEIDALVQKIIA